jgi:hypothetical protein
MLHKLSIDRTVIFTRLTFGVVLDRGSAHEAFVFSCLLLVPCIAEGRLLGTTPHERGCPYLHGVIAKPSNKLPAL